MKKGCKHQTRAAVEAGAVAPLVAKPNQPRPWAEMCLLCGARRVEDALEQTDGRLGWFWGEWTR
jgi:hypothetical protein